MDEAEELIEDLEEDIGELEHDFDQVKDNSADGSLREKQEKAEELLDEIHGQLEFLREQMDKE